MKKLTLFLSLIAVSAFAQDAAVQTGTPAKLEAINGKVIKVFLQSLSDGKISFQPVKSTKTITVGIDKVAGLEFFQKYDAKELEKNFNTGDFAAVLSLLEPMMEPYAAYMPIKNNLQDPYVMMLKAQYGIGDYSKARKSAERLMGSTGDTRLVDLGQIFYALATLKQGDAAAAEKLQAEVDSEAAKLYLSACILQEQGKPELAKDKVNLIIADHGNEVDWLGPAELLNASLYLDAGLTNSAISTASMVKNMYDGSNVSGAAAKLLATLPVEEEPAPEAVEVPDTSEETEMTEEAEMTEDVVESADAEMDEDTKQAGDAEMPDTAESTEEME